MKRVCIVGFPYVRDNYRKTFDFFSDPKPLFILPRSWSVKKGKVRYEPAEDANIITTSAFFHHSDYPIIGGLLKGLMPALPVHLWRIRHEIGTVYTCSEPTLLTTLYHGFWAKCFGLKNVLFSWENIPYEEKFSGFNWFLKRWIMRLNFWLADGLVCGNAKAKAIHSVYTRLPMAVIPMNGVDDDFFNPIKAAKHFRDYDFSDAMVASFIGALGYRKGVHRILEATALLRSQFPKLRIIIAGSGEYEARIAELISQLRLEDIVIRIPWLSHDEVRDVLSVSDIFLYPSIPYHGWAEQFGYSMAEASLMEVPVISTHTGSIDEVVRDGETGVLVEADDVEALANAMRRLLEDQSMRDTLGRQARRYIQEQYSHAHIAARYEAFFKTL